MQIGVLDVGGGLRGSFGAGVLDCCMDHKIVFPYGIGVSAGAANITSYMANQRGRNLVFYTKFFERKEYMSVQNLVQTGAYIGLDYIYSTLSDQSGEYPLDWKYIEDHSRKMTVVATNALTGNPHYFHETDMGQDHYDPIKGSCCVPVLDPPYVIEGIPYFDGGLSDPIPVLKAFEEGCDKVVVILTRPRDFKRVSKKDTLIVDALKHTYPMASVAMDYRAKKYNLCLDLCTELEKQGKVFICAPDSIGNMKTLTKDKKSIEDLYLKGYAEGERLVQSSFLEN